MKVMKFGGSSVADPQRIRTVTDIVLRAAMHNRIRDEMVHTDIKRTA